MPGSGTVKSFGFSFLSNIIKQSYITSRMYFFDFYPNIIFKSNLGHIECQFCAVEELDGFSKGRLSVVSINICQFINSLNKISRTSNFIPSYTVKQYNRSYLRLCKVLIQKLSKPAEIIGFPSRACTWANSNTSKYFTEWAWWHFEIWDR